MMYTISKYKNIYGLDLPVVAIITGYATYTSFPFNESRTSATVSVYVDSENFRDKIELGIAGDIDVSGFDIHPIDTKYIVIEDSAEKTMILGLSNSNVSKETIEKEIISKATGIQVEMIKSDI